MDAFIRADGNRPADLRQSIILASGKRLLDQRDACRLAGRKILLKVMRRPCLVGIHDQF